jgi:nucleoside-diphosphate-sugar epimerase
MDSCVILGAGRIGQALADALSVRYRVVMVRRHWPHGIPANALAKSILELQPQDMPADCAAVVFLASPDAYTPDAYAHTFNDCLRHALDWCAQATPSPKRFIMASSTAVFHQQDGEWVDECSPTQPRRFNGKALLAAERLCAASSMETLICRFAGIYGHGCSHWLTQLQTGRAQLAQEDYWINLIHHHDVVGILHYFMMRDVIPPLLVCVDDEPVRQHCFWQWLAEQCGLPCPPQAQQPSARRHGGDRRCCNDLLRQFGYDMRFASFREGFRAQITALKKTHKNNNGESP